MSKTVDFTQSNLNNYNKIIRPDVAKRNESKSQKKNNSSHVSIKIQKSFQPEVKSSINPALRPEIQKLKQIYKKKHQQQKKMKALLADGKISRHQLQNKEHAKTALPKDNASDRLVVDESGQVRDDKGNLIFIRNRTNELLINQKKDQENQLKMLAKRQKIKVHQRLSKVFVDRNLIVSTSKKRIRRGMLGLQFLQKGSYQPYHIKQEVKNQIYNLSDVFAQNKDEQADNVKYIKKRNRVSLQYNKQIPQIEWWDAPLLNNLTYLQVLGLGNTATLAQIEEKITTIHLSHFISFELMSAQMTYQKVGSGSQQQRIILPMYLTKDQRKKLKRKRKREKLLERNDKVKLGLIQPQKPKLRVANMAIVLKNQFIMDPSKVQSQAKKQTQQRINKHLQANSSKKLTKNQKKDKIIRKLKRDSAKQCRRAVFKLAKLVEPSHIFKVNMNAKQLALNGFVIKPANETIHQPTFILVEGGIRAIKFYKNLMINRIRWNQNDHTNQCRLVWQGQIQNTTAGKWKIHQVFDEVQVIRLLSQKKLEHFWDYVCD